MEWDDKKVKNLISLYHSRELLWNPKHIDYKKRPKRHDALNEIAIALSTNILEIERKIKNLTSHYLREKKRENTSKKFGAGTKDIYHSKWFAYKLLNFLCNKNKPTPGIVTDTLKRQESETQQRDSRRLSQNDEMSTEKTLPPPKKRFKNNPKEEMKSRTLSIIKNISQRRIETKVKNEDDLFGEYIAEQLKKMDRQTKAFARHRINYIIFEAETGQYRASNAFSDSERPSTSHSYSSTSISLPLDTDPLSQDVKNVLESFHNTN